VKYRKVYALNVTVKVNREVSSVVVTGSVKRVRELVFMLGVRID